MFHTTPSYGAVGEGEFIDNLVTCMYTVQVSQLNVNMTPEFERALQRLMRIRGIANKSEAVRIAVIEAADRERVKVRSAAFHELRGAGLRAPQRTRPRFASEDDLWR